VAVKHSDTEYELIAGERRLEACKLAGLTEVPVFIKNVSDKEKLVLAIIENVQREDLSPIEEAKAYEQLINEFELTHLDLSKIMSKDRATITNTLRLLKLSESIQAMIESKQITPGHARAVLSVDESVQEQFAAEIVKKQYTVRKAELESQNYNIITQKPKASNTNKTYENNYLKEIEKELASTTGCAVDIKEKKDGLGEILIQFKDKDDLEKIRSSMKVANKLVNYFGTYTKAKSE
jgi:ParB family chromosome partitioning protein